MQEIVRVDAAVVERRVEHCDLDGAADVYFVGDVFGRESQLARSAIAYSGEVEGISFVHWDVMPAAAAERDVWFVHVHGMGAAPSPTLRSVETVREAGYPSTIVSLEASADIDTRSRGMAPEHLDRVLAAVDHAVSFGARKVVLAGWSYGARLALEASALRAAVAGAILIAPMLDFMGAFSLVATQRRLPAALIACASEVLTTPILCRLAGIREPIEPWRSPQLTPPLLVIHSEGDQSVPFELSQELLEAMPAARQIKFPASPHTLEWNVDPERFASEVRAWVDSSLQGRP
ncbi:alpha/beta fold hydrolase [Agromyces sp. ZXT2-6]|uniref:alpha/beta fold hydrolase n=1 Tax=Agromyces sp. ZXT2-6 TaxID=3461153 RepID=UPI0040552080